MGQMTIEERARAVGMLVSGLSLRQVVLNFNPLTICLSTLHSISSNLYQTARLAWANGIADHES